MTQCHLLKLMQSLLDKLQPQLKETIEPQSLELIQTPTQSSIKLCFSRWKMLSKMPNQQSLFNKRLLLSQNNLSKLRNQSQLLSQHNLHRNSLILSQTMWRWTKE